MLVLDTIAMGRFWLLFMVRFKRKHHTIHSNKHLPNNKVRSKDGAMCHPIGVAINLISFFVFLKDRSVQFQYEKVLVFRIMLFFSEREERTSPIFSV